MSKHARAQQTQGESAREGDARSSDVNGVGKPGTPLDARLEKLTAEIRKLRDGMSAAEERAARMAAEASERAEAQRLAETKAAAASEARAAAEARAAQAEGRAEAAQAKLESEVAEGQTPSTAPAEAVGEHAEQEHSEPHASAWRLEPDFPVQQLDREDASVAPDEVFATAADKRTFLKKGGPNAPRLLGDWCRTDGTITAELAGGASDGTRLMFEEHRRHHHVPLRPGRARRLMGLAPRFEVYAVKRIWLERPSWSDRPVRHALYEPVGRRTGEPLPS